jgi:hypothetical protein
MSAVSGPSLLPARDSWLKRLPGPKTWRGAAGSAWRRPKRLWEPQATPLQPNLASPPTGRSLNSIRSRGKGLQLVRCSGRDDLSNCAGPTMLLVGLNRMFSRPLQSPRAEKSRLPTKILSYCPSFRHSHLVWVVRIPLLHSPQTPRNQKCSKYF